MATENIYTYALRLFKAREEYYTKQAEQATSHTVKQAALSEASAYHSAWWILYYAIHENWECLEQYDYFAKGE